MKIALKLTLNTMSLCCYSCGAASGPILLCPESIPAGDVVSIEATGINDALIWTIFQGNLTEASFVLSDGSEGTGAITNVIGDPGAGTGSTEITVRATVPGDLHIYAQETLIGPALSVFPPFLGKAICVIQVTAAE